LRSLSPFRAAAAIEARQGALVLAAAGFGLPQSAG